MKVWHQNTTIIGDTVSRCPILQLWCWNYPCFKHIINHGITPSLWKTGSQFEILCTVDSNILTSQILILHALQWNEVIYKFLGLKATELKNISVAIVGARIETEKLACLNQMEISIKRFKYLYWNKSKIYVNFRKQ